MRTILDDLDLRILKAIMILNMNGVNPDVEQLANHLNMRVRFVSNRLNENRLQQNLAKGD